jgi:protocatechuate 3,4-dioxygenase beta subunit
VEGRQELRTKELRKVTRREALGALGATGMAVALGCGEGSPTSPTTTTTTTTTTTAGGSSTCAVIPSETEGPYPSNSLLLRRDITEGKAGLPLTVQLMVVNVNSSCTPVPGATVEIWHCDASGYYSEYSQPGYDGRSATYLRGAQTTDSTGVVTFTSIYPGWYSGRATHIHVEVYVNGVSVKTTQLAFPESVTSAVYGTGVYTSKGQNPTGNDGDNVFSDGHTLELATLTGDITNGYTAALQIGIAV